MAFAIKEEPIANTSPCLHSERRRLVNGVRSYISPAVILLTKLRVRYHLIVTGNAEHESGPVIYTFNHTNSADIPMACRVVKEHCKVLIGRQRLFLSDRLFFWLNSAIWVDRKDKQDMQRAKQDLINTLRKKESVIWFPEGTWNQTDNLLMLPMKWGIVDVAQKSGARIIPIILEYEKARNICHATIGESIDPSGLSLSEGIILLRDSMATLRWQIWESKGVFARTDLDIGQERLALEQDIKDYPPLDWEYEQSVVFQPTQ